jgi:hypothetical protein
MIAPIMIICGKRYVQMAVICINSFTKHHKNTTLYVATNKNGREFLEPIFEAHNVCFVDIKKYLKIAMNYVGVYKYQFVKIDSGYHNRAFSALKPLIMDEIIYEYEPDSNYVLSLDVDTIFSGNILNVIENYLNDFNHNYDLYMVERIDPRMQLMHNLSPGSGFTLWKRNGKFIEKFIEKFDSECHKGKYGGSQRIINFILEGHEIKGTQFKDPLLHFISPDIINKKITDEEIIELQPAYIHLHGPNSYERLLNFERVFCGL